MRIRPGRTRSLFVGVMMLLVMIFGLLMMGQFGGLTGGLFGPFIVVWVVIGLAGAAMAFYNALSKEGLPLYEVDMEESREYLNEQDAGAFCPQCGRPAGEDDQFCRHCGASLNE